MSDVVVFVGSLLQFKFDKCFAVYCFCAAIEPPRMISSSSVLLRYSWDQFAVRIQVWKILIGRLSNKSK